MKYSVNYNNKTIDVPSSWNDLTKKDFLFVVKHFSGILSVNADVNSEEFVNNYYASRMLLIKRLLRFNFFQFKNITAAQFADLLPLTDFLNDPIDLDVQHLPKIRVGGKTFFGPSTGLKHSSFAEFTSADTYYVNMSKKDSPELIYKLAATLYRPAQPEIKRKQLEGTWNGDLRQDFNSDILQERADFFQKKMNAQTAWAILYFYWGFRNKYVLRFKNLFEDPKESNEVERVGNQYGWAGTILEISGDKFGDVKSTKATYWFEVFIELSRQLDIQKKREAFG